MAEQSVPRIAHGNIRTLAEGLDHPEGVAWGPDGFIYAGGEAGQIYRIKPQSGVVQEIANTGGFVLGLALDGTGGLYACDLGRHAVLKIDLSNGEVSTYTAGLPELTMRSPNYPVFDVQGNLYVSDLGVWLQEERMR